MTCRISVAGSVLVLTALPAPRVAGAQDTLPRRTVLDEVVVTAARRPQRLADAVSTTELVSRADIARTGASDLATVLTQQPGIQLEGGIPAGAGVMLQGLGSRRVLVLVDGQPLYGRISGLLDLSRLPAAAVERIEVVKGPQSTLYGSDAMGGVINIVTRRAEPDRWTTEARLLTGTLARLDGDLGAAYARGALAARTDVGRRSVQRAPGVAGQAGALAERTDVNTTVRWGSDSARVLETGLLFIRERQRWMGGTLYNFGDNTQLGARLGGAWRVGSGAAHRIAPTLYLSRFDHLLRQSAYTRPIAGTGTRQLQQLAKGDLLYNGSIAGQLVDAGVELRQEFLSSSDGRIGPARTRASAEPFAQLTWTSGRVAVVPGARATWSQQWGSAVTPRIAARMLLAPGLTARASVASGFRVPDFKELYLDFANDQAGYVVSGNPALRPERSTNLTVGAEWLAARRYLRGQLYWNGLRSLIETVLLPASGPVQRFSYDNVARAMTRGAEIEAGATLGVLELRGSASALATRDLGTGGPLLGRPPRSGSASASYVVPHRALGGTRATLTLLHTGRTPLARDAATGGITLVRDPFTRTNLQLVQPLPGALTLTLGADNLLGARPRNWPGVVSRQIYAGLAIAVSGLTRGGSSP